MAFPQTAALGKDDGASVFSIVSGIRNFAFGPARVFVYGFYRGRRQEFVMPFTIFDYVSRRRARTGFTPVSPDNPFLIIIVLRGHVNSSFSGNQLYKPDIL